MSEDKVGNLMKPVKDLDRVSRDEYFENIIDIFVEDEIENRHSKVLAVEENNKIIGILSLGDIIRTLKKLTRSFGREEIFKSSSSLNSFDTTFLKRKTERDLEVGFSLKVKEIMMNNRKKINIENLPITALDILMENNLRVLPVHNERGIIVGIIRDVDLLEHIVKIWNKGR